MLLSFAVRETASEIAGCLAQKNIGSSTEQKEHRDGPAVDCRLDERRNR